MNRNYIKGRNYEYRAMRILEKDGYYCLRSAGSHKAFDILALLQRDGLEVPLVRAIQIKSGKSPYKKDLRKLEDLNLPYCVEKELWIFSPRKKEPKIIIVDF